LFAETITHLNLSCSLGRALAGEEHSARFAAQKMKKHLNSPSVDSQERLKTPTYLQEVSTAKYVVSLSLPKRSRPIAPHRLFFRKLEPESRKLELTKSMIFLISHGVRSGKIARARYVASSGQFVRYLIQPTYHRVRMNKIEFFI
jgi:hypothetical protein